MNTKLQDNPFGKNFIDFAENRLRIVRGFNESLRSFLNVKLCMPFVVLLIEIHHLGSFI